MAGRLIAIGDIHGCAAALKSLLRAIDPQPEDTIVPLGDYVDRGPDSRGVIDLLLQLQDQCQLIPLRGNHEEMMLSGIHQPQGYAWEVWQECGGRQTLRSYGGQPEDVPEEHRVFLENCRLFYETEKFVFVHANYYPDIDWPDQPQHMLQWEHLDFTLPGPHESGKIVVVGHSSRKDGNPLLLDHLWCIDTFCYGGGWLTAIEVQSEELWQANTQGELRTA